MKNLHLHIVSIDKIKQKIYIKILNIKGPSMTFDGIGTSFYEKFESS